jgi:hypothetical protein
MMHNPPQSVIRYPAQPLFRYKIFNEAYLKMQKLQAANKHMTHTSPTTILSTCGWIPLDWHFPAHRDKPNSTKKLKARKINNGGGKVWSITGWRGAARNT